MSDLLHSLQEKLEAERVTPIMARDGILESYVITNRKALDAGVGSSVVNLPDEEVLGLMKEMMSVLFHERGANFDAPTVSELRSIRHTMDLKLRLSDLPLDASEMHDIVCEMLLARTEEGYADGIIQPQRLDEPLSEFTGFSPEPVTVSPGTTREPSTASSEISQERSLVRSPFAASMEAKLGFDLLSPQDARDGIIESFVTAKAGALGEPGLNPDVALFEGETEIFVKGMMRDLLSELGSSFDEPSLDALAEAARRIGEKLEIIRMPEAVRIRHNETCEILLSRAHRLVDALAGIPAAEVVAPREGVAPVKELIPEEASIEADVLGTIDRLAETPRPQPEPQHRPESLPEPVPQLESIEEPVEKPVPLSLEDILARVRSELKEMISRELRSALDKERVQPVRLSPPAGIAAKVEGHTVFLAWLDSFEQPGYNVYRREGERWVKLTPVPLSRPSFHIRIEEEGEVCFAVTVISPQGTESELSPEVRVHI